MSRQAEGEKSIVSEKLGFYVGALQAAGGALFASLVAGMLASPARTFAVFPWVLGFWVHLAANVAFAALFWGTTCAMIASSQEVAFVAGSANTALLIAFGSLVLLSGQGYGGAEVLLGVVLLAMLLLLRRERLEAVKVHRTGK